MFKSITPKDPSTIVSPNVVCQHCKARTAEIFQESGDYCLNCWQEKTCPVV